MARLEYRSISKRTVDGLSVGDKDTVFWDRELSGFGVRVYPSGAKVYVVQTRALGKSKRVTLGRHGVISADQARRKAAMTIARIKAGEDPSPTPSVSVAELTVADLAERYLKEHAEVHCKPRTKEAYRWLVVKFVLPELGKLAIEAVEREHIAALHYGAPRDTLSGQSHPRGGQKDVQPGRGVGSAEVTVANPCRFVQKYKERKRERFLTERGIPPAWGRF